MARDKPKPGWEAHFWDAGEPFQFSLKTKERLLDHGLSLPIIEQLHWIVSYGKVLVEFHESIPTFGQCKEALEQGRRKHTDKVKFLAWENSLDEKTARLLELYSGLSPVNHDNFLEAAGKTLKGIKRRSGRSLNDEQREIAEIVAKLFVFQDLKISMYEPKKESIYISKPNGKVEKAVRAGTRDGSLFSIALDEVFTACGIGTTNLAPYIKYVIHFFNLGN